jgi:DNA invertase Pin-like site-specific DNA recombinase
MMYGYARVSTDGQTLDAQVAALKAAGAEKVFSEKQSGAKTDRAALAKALAALASGDVLVVKQVKPPRPPGHEIAILTKPEVCNLASGR